MVDYSKLNDLQINEMVLHHLENGNAMRLQQMSVASGETDYCNNPADAWPIIVDSKITVHAPMRNDKPQEWLAFDVHNSDANFKEDKNPLRAAMIVFLMMQEQKP